MIQYIRASNPQQADVEEIMTRVDFCTAHPATNAMKALEGSGLDYFIQSIDTDRAAANYSYNLRLPVIVREPGMKGFVKFIMKKIIGKSLRWYMMDLIAQQTSCNANLIHYANSVDDTFRAYIQHTEAANEMVMQQLLKTSNSTQINVIRKEEDR